MPTAPSATCRAASSAAGSFMASSSPTNTYDLDAAWRIVADFSAPTVAMVKHGNPVGLACGNDLPETDRRALAVDPQTAFGGAVSLNRIVDEATAREISEVFFEDLIAPD